MKILEKDENVDKKIVGFIENSLFTTLTNVNFDGDAHVKMLKESQKIKEALRKSVGDVYKRQRIRSGKHKLYLPF